MHNYHTIHDVLPAASWGTPGTGAGNDGNIRPGEGDLPQSSPATAGGNRMRYSAWVAILPFIELNAIDERIKINAHISPINTSDNNRWGGTNTNADNNVESQYSGDINVNPANCMATRGTKGQYNMESNGWFRFVCQRFG
jgi:hypothetical protein